MLYVWIHDDGPFDVFAQVELAEDLDEVLATGETGNCLEQFVLLDFQEGQWGEYDDVLDGAVEPVEGVGVFGELVVLEEDLSVAREQIEFLD